MNIEYLKEIIKQKYENEYIEFKHNWKDKDGIGEYISAISNSAAIHGVDYGYLIWGIDDNTHEIVGTNFNPDMDVNGEPLKHYLARNLIPSIDFNFDELVIDNKKLVVLTIPSARSIITEFKKERFIRIGSSKELLRKYPEREMNLWLILKNGLPTIINTESTNQNLTFTTLQTYYISKGLNLNLKTFKDNLNLYVPNTKKYNLMAYILSDNNEITCRVSVFNGKSKADIQYALNDYGFKSILITIDQVINYLESFNIVMLDETNRIVERKDIPLFNSECLREVILNSFIHNDWNSLNAPMISVFTDRIEILSYGGIPSKQTIIGFFDGKSQPRCNELAQIFLQLRISERSGRGITKVVETYGRESFKIEEDYIKVTIPFVKERTYGSLENDINIKNNRTAKSVQTMNRIINEISNNPHITTNQLMSKLNLGKTSVQSYVRELNAKGYITRIGSKKNGYWKICK
ncbi:MAG: putative DNA binding domain-containing protein [Bacilli bacterium]|nr:putative DNA binding domain-containing protein [Bacilli bacterium]